MEDDSCAETPKSAILALPVRVSKMFPDLMSLKRTQVVTHVIDQYSRDMKITFLIEVFTCECISSSEDRIVLSSSTPSQHEFPPPKREWLKWIIKSVVSTKTDG